MSKGSRRRPENRKRLDKNWDKIKWKSKDREGNGKREDRELRNLMSESLKIDG